MEISTHTHDEIVVFTPRMEDALITNQILGFGKFTCHHVSSMHELTAHLSSESGIVLISEECLTKEGLAGFLKSRSAQASWSDIPILIITSPIEDPQRAQKLFDAFNGIGSLTFLERPLKPVLVLSAVVSALHTRDRQFEVKNLLAQKLSLIEKAQKALHIRDEFLSIASHELKTPITTLKLRHQMIRRELEKPGEPALADKMNKFLKVSENQIEKLICLVGDLLDISRIENGKFLMQFEEKDLDAIINDSLNRIRDQIQQSDCCFSLKLEAGLTALWDTTRLEQAMINLITNSLKYAPGSQINITLKRQNSKAVIDFRDNGPGISPTKLDLVFDRFERADAAPSIAGLGLGLYIVKQIVKEHEGDIALQSCLGQGVHFVIELPIRQEALPLFKKAVQ